MREINVDIYYCCCGISLGTSYFGNFIEWEMDNFQVLFGGVSSLQGFWLIGILIGISDHLNIWSDFLACHEIWFFLFGMNIKSQG